MSRVTLSFLATVVALGALLGVSRNSPANAEPLFEGCTSVPDVVGCLMNEEISLSRELEDARATIDANAKHLPLGGVIQVEDANEGLFNCPDDYAVASATCVNGSGPAAISTIGGKMTARCSSGRIVGLCLKKD